MHKLLLLRSFLGCSLLLTTPTAFSAVNVVELQTTLGTIAIQLDPVHAPTTVSNFITYAVTQDFYKNVFFHRLVKDFVLQGGGFSITDGKLKATLNPIANEANNGLSNLIGTVAMARTSDPNSATSQFFINLSNNTSLNYSATSAGYAVFGSVTTATMPVVNKIANLAGNYNELPFSSNGKPSAGLVSIDAVYTSDALDSAQSITRVLVKGSGQVVSTPAGIDCGSSCSLSLAVGSAISLTATASAGYRFLGWRGDCQGFRRVLQLDTNHGNHNCTAIFKPLGAEIQ